MAAERSSTTARRGPSAAAYREAAEATLEQLDWCVAYFERIHKPAIARAIAANRTKIRRDLRSGDR